MAIKISAEAEYEGRELDDGLRSINQSINDLRGSFTELNSALELGAKVIGGLTKVIGTVVGVTAQWTKASINAQESQLRLAAVTGSSFKALQQYNSELQRKLGIDDDDLAATQTKLRAMGVQTAELERATRATIGFADATGKDLLAATRTVAQAFRKGGDEVARLEGLFKVSEATASTFGGELRRLNTLWGEMEETLGDAVTKSSAFRDAMQASSVALTSFINIFGSEEGQLLIDGFFRKIAGGIAAAINAFLGLRSLISNVAAGETDIQRALRQSAASTHDKLREFGLPEWAANIIAKKNVQQGDQGFVGPPALVTAFDAATDAAQRFADALTAIATGKPTLLEPPKFSSGGGGGGGGSKNKPPLDRSLPFGLQPGDRAATPDAPSNHFQDASDLADSFDLLIKETNKKARDWKDDLEQAAVAGVQALGGLITGAVQAVVSGSETLLGAVGKLFGGLMVQMGTFLIQIGTVGVLAGALGTVIPALKAITGGELGVALGLAAVAGGVLMVAAGTALGGSGGGGRSGPTSARPRPNYSSGGGGGSNPARVGGVDGFVSAPGGGNTYINKYEISFDTAIVEGTEAGLGRRLERMIDRSRRLRGLRAEGT